jgi:hypothetical protein
MALPDLQSPAFDPKRELFHSAVLWSHATHNRRQTRSVVYCGLLA